MAKVILENVRKEFGKNTVAVENFNLCVEDGEFVVLVGPSGCGKSTTLRLIAGLEDLTSGEIYIGETLASALPPKDRDIAMVFQNYALYPHMTAYQNMGFGLKLRKYPKEEIDRRVREAADILGIADLLDRRPGELSGGQRQRVAVGRAIVRKPKVFLFDEPLSNLDAQLRVQMRAEIKKLHTKLGATMIYVTHDQVEAMTMGDRLVVMRNARIQQIGAPVDVYHHPNNRFVAGFIGSPSMNFLEGRLASNNGVVFAHGDLCLPIPERHHSLLQTRTGAPAVLGIRPEHVEYAGSRAQATVGRATVELVEPMGNETHLYVTLGGASLVARVPPENPPAEGDGIDLAFNLSAINLFDPETGESWLKKKTEP